MILFRFLSQIYKFFLKKTLFHLNTDISKNTITTRLIEIYNLILSTSFEKKNEIITQISI